MKTALDAALARMNDVQVPSPERLDAVDSARRILRTPDMDAVCEVDLHCHSFHSDGYNSPASRVFEAWRRKMKAVAIADHDLFDGQWEAVGAGAILGVRVVPAVEFYTDRPGVEIIGHFPDVRLFMELLDSGVPGAVVEPIREAKRRQLDAMMARVPECMARLGLRTRIAPGDIETHVRNGVSTKGDISVILWQKHGAELAAAGHAADVKDFHAKFTTRPEALDVPLELAMDISPAAFIRRIADWGGLPGLAHPCELRNKEGLDNAASARVLAALAEEGLQTIEVDGFRNGICPECGLHQTLLFDRMRQDFNAAHPGRLPLLPTNGSDDHNQPGEGLELGCGKGRNLDPAFGTFAAVLALEARQRELLARRAPPAARLPDAASAR